MLDKLYINFVFYLLREVLWKFTPLPVVEKARTQSTATPSRLEWKPSNPKVCQVPGTVRLTRFAGTTSSCAGTRADFYVSAVRSVPVARCWCLPLGRDSTASGSGWAISASDGGTWSGWSSSSEYPSSDPIPCRIDRFWSICRLLQHAKWKDTLVRHRTRTETRKRCAAGSHTGWNLILTAEKVTINKTELITIWIIYKLLINSARVWYVTG